LRLRHNVQSMLAPTSHQIEAAEVFAYIARERLMAPMDLQASQTSSAARSEWRFALQRASPSLAWEGVPVQKNWPSREL
jgi:hypothetical protein